MTCKHEFCLSVEDEVIAEDEIITLKCNNVGCSEEKVFRINSLFLEEITNDKINAEEHGEVGNN